MHLADSVLSLSVAGISGVGAAGLVGYAAARVRKSGDTGPEAVRMGIWGAFVFAVQMINVPIMGTGASGHLVGALLLCLVLGPYRAYLTLAAVLVIQSLLFADGGLLALGANLLNMGAFTCFIAYPYVYQALKGHSTRRMVGACVLASLVGLELGAFAVVLEVGWSGMVALPMGTFMGLMLGIHLPIALFEGVVTALVWIAVRRASPDMITESEVTVTRRRSLALQSLGVLVLTAAVAGALSWLASTSPDGLEWSLMRSGPESGTVMSGVHSKSAALQEQLAVYPDYEVPEESSLHGGASVISIPGLAGSLVVLILAGTLGFVVRRRNTGT